MLCVAVMMLQVDAFRPNIPLIVGLRSAGMRDRHWDELAHEIKFRLKLDETFTLTRVLQMNLLSHVDAIRKVR